eukprot:Sspe_Gene.3928::Locus_1310_Transcript_1_1_Confidence_1.000_Length_1873::g.3928::m.3928
MQPDSPMDLSSRSLGADIGSASADDDHQNSMGEIAELATNGSASPVASTKPADSIRTPHRSTVAPISRSSPEQSDADVRIRELLSQLPAVPTPPPPPAAAVAELPCVISSTKVVVRKDVERVKMLVDALSQSRGGPLPEWDTVYESHCGMAGEIVEERADLGCVRIDFLDGYKYWFPAAAVTWIKGNGVVEEKSPKRPTHLHLSPVAIANVLEAIRMELETSDIVTSLPTLSPSLDLTGCANGNSSASATVVMSEMMGLVRALLREIRERDKRIKELADTNGELRNQALPYEHRLRSLEQEVETLRYKSEALQKALQEKYSESLAAKNEDALRRTVLGLQAENQSLRREHEMAKDLYESSKAEYESLHKRHGETLKELASEKVVVTRLQIFADEQRRLAGTADSSSPSTPKKTSRSPAVGTRNCTRSNSPPLRSRPRSTSVPDAPPVRTSDLPGRRSSGHHPQPVRTVPSAAIAAMAQQRSASPTRPWGQQRVTKPSPYPEKRLAKPRAAQGLRQSSVKPHTQSHQAPFKKGEVDSCELGGTTITANGANTTRNVASPQALSTRYGKRDPETARAKVSAMGRSTTTPLPMGFRKMPRTLA